MGSPVPRGVVDVDPRVPHVERPHSCESGHRLPVPAGDREVDLLPGLRVESTAASRDREARDEALEVPLERARERLVEIVHIEYEPPVGGGIAAEVGQVRVAAELHVQPRPRHAGEIGSHDVGRAAIEGEGREEHAPVPDRDELLDPALRLQLEQVDRVVAQR